MWTRPKAEKVFQPVTPRSAASSMTGRLRRCKRIRSPDAAASASKPAELIAMQAVRKSQGDISPTATFMAGQFVPQRKLTAPIRTSASGGTAGADLEVGAASTLLPIAKTGGLRPPRAIDF